MLIIPGTLAGMIWLSTALGRDEQDLHRTDSSRLPSREGA